MDDIQKSFSKLKKGFKHRLGSKKLASDRAGDNTTGERADSSASLQQPDPRITVGGRDGEGSRADANVLQAHSRDPPPRPEPVPVDQGHLDDPQEKEVDVSEKEVIRRRSSLDLDVGGAAGSSPRQEVGRTPFPSPVISIPSKQEPDSTWTLSPQTTVSNHPFRQYCYPSRS